MQDGLIRKLQTKSQTGDYDVIIGSGVLQHIDEYLSHVIEKNAPLLLVYDQSLEDYGYPAQVKASLLKNYAVVTSFALPSGEHSKSLAMAGQLYQAAIKAGLDRNAVILALGGGVTGDLAGFVAATYMRGVRFIQIPTTLLAHDSSIGGKVAVNLPEGKNLVGAFHSPELVIYDVHLLQSLPEREMASGMAEAIKHGVIANPTLFEYIETNAEYLLHNHQDKMIDLLYMSCQVKANVVSEDERENGLRAILNFGHTVGHALEAIDYGAYTHGEAVAIGMMVETEISNLMGLAQLGTKDRLGELLRRCHLPAALPESQKTPEQQEALIEQMRRDKKAELRSLAFVLPKTIGEVKIVKDVSEDMVRSALRS